MTGWRDRAACLDHDPEVFFPAGRYGIAYQQQVARAKTICRSCPVVVECRADAARTRDHEFGIRAGLTPDERRSAASDAGRADRDAELTRTLAAVRALPAAAWAALRGADGRGNLPVRTSSEARRALVQVGLADETLSGRRSTSAVRLNAAGRALGAQRRGELTGVAR